MLLFYNAVLNDVNIDHKTDYNEPFIILKWNKEGGMKISKELIFVKSKKNVFDI